MGGDIRKKSVLNQEDVLDLNFIKSPPVYVFRRNYRQGLRSHLIQVLKPEDVQYENQGVLIDGFRWYPRAEPSIILRIFRQKFESILEAEEEIRNFKITRSHLAPDNLAVSQEVLVDYKLEDRWEIMLCGFQEYVQGEILDPWRCLNENYLASLLSVKGFQKRQHKILDKSEWICLVRQQAEIFIEKVKRMIIEKHHVPDLAGVGNLILSPQGKIKLVDINNISRVSFDQTIPLDDKGYPVCDKSIQALSLLEKNLLDKGVDQEDIIYKTFLDPKRVSQVDDLERASQRSLAPEKTVLGKS